jgi:hypothetical protein
MLAEMIGQGPGQVVKMKSATQILPARSALVTVCPLRSVNENGGTDAYLRRGGVRLIPGRTKLTINRTLITTMPRVRNRIEGGFIAFESIDSAWGRHGSQKSHHHDDTDS